MDSEHSPNFRPVFVTRLFKTITYCYNFERFILCLLPIIRFCILVKRHNYKLGFFGVYFSNSFLISVNVLCAKATGVLKADQNMTSSIAL